MNAEGDAYADFWSESINARQGIKTLVFGR